MHYLSENDSRKESLSLFNGMVTLLNTNHDYITTDGSKNLLQHFQVNLFFMMKAY